MRASAARGRELADVGFAEFAHTAVDLIIRNFGVSGGPLRQ
jgi:hypothetical protein